MSAATDYTEANALNYLLTTNALTGNNARPTAWYVGLFTAAPSDTGGGTEVSGGSYAREAVTFSVSATGSPATTTATNTTTITFTTASANWGTITHVGIFTLVSSGTLLFWGSVTTSKVIESGDTFQITAGNLSIELQ